MNRSEGTGDPARAAILVVDDRPEGVRTLQAVLEAVGERVLTASSGQEALERTLSEDFAVILLDARMPGMDGFETAKYLRSRRKTRHTPIIFVTGMDERLETIERVYAVGAVDCLFKPFLPEVLRSKVRFFLDLHRKSAALENANQLLEREIGERKRAEVERNRAQAELLQGQKLQAIGQLAAGIAHEINNPISYILSNLRTLQEYLEELGPYLREADVQRTLGTSISGTGAGLLRTNRREAREVESMMEDFECALKDCHTGAERIRRIVRGLREFIHPGESQFREVDLSEVLESALDLCANELRCGVTVHRDYQPSPKVSCYPGQIEQVLVNLIVNAVQAMEGKKGHLFIGARLEAGSVAVSIRDTGPGISAENQAKLFLPFFTTKPVGKGTGLGLHVAYKIVRAHGGQIDVRSDEGKGSEFIVKLPLAARSSGGL